MYLNCTILCGLKPFTVVFFALFSVDIKAIWHNSFFFFLNKISNFAIENNMNKLSMAVKG